MTIDQERWSGDGAFTEVLVESLKRIPEVVFLRIEDAPASRADTGYNFIANELYVGFGSETAVESRRLFGFLPVKRTVARKAMTLPLLETALSGFEEIGPPDYADEGMLQYLRTERIVPPYQTRGYKLVELVRMYEIGGAHDAARRSSL